MSWDYPNFKAYVGLRAVRRSKNKISMPVAPMTDLEYYSLPKDEMEYFKEVDY